MFNSDEAITIRYDLDKYIEDIVNELSDEECQEVIDSIPDGCLSGILIPRKLNGIVKPKHIKRYLRYHIRKMMLSNLEE